MDSVLDCSAMRGSLGIMSWSFSLFCIAFTVPAAIQFFIGVASAMPMETKFPKLKMLDVIISMVLSLSYIFSVIATYLLVVSVYYINSSPDATGSSGNIFFTNAPRIASLSAIAFMAFMSFLVRLLYFQLFRGKRLGALCSVLQLL